MRIGLIAGSGQFPLIFLKMAQSKGYTVYVAAYINEADPLLDKCADAVIRLHLGQIRRLIRFFKKNNVNQTVMMGAVNKTRIFTDVKPDTLAISLLAKLRHTQDDNLLSVFAGVLEKKGIRVQPATLFMPDMLADAGCWTRRQPSRSEKNDIEFGWEIAYQIGKLDIGQCVVVGGGSVLAVEAIDGTDATILRGGKLGKGHAIVVKRCKPNQDTRFDMPAVGIDTIKTMRMANIKVLIIEAGKAVVFDRREMIDRADLSDITIVAK
ncbi:UDP-2,3-diacylglucosamine diphosphatase LpxI [Desulfococcaceae bacterium HSG7]|nr:UDP-2,3-diacylglucosamine diphosphatase LpxI [Desulfococcaceae bacterium HSG9]MDM8554499.1 UDP-2,3-diacylglucosamine diphosphatase LpxI [Desulfococcaceae bacterium HSG7]